MSISSVMFFNEILIRTMAISKKLYRSDFIGDYF